MPTAVKPKPTSRRRAQPKPIQRLRRGHAPLPGAALPRRAPHTAVTGDARTIKRALVIICFGAFMSSIDATVTNVALSTLEHDLHSSVASVQWVMTAYMLTVAAIIPVSGWASRRFGARRVYVCSLAMFGLSSGLCALSGTLGMLVACRLLQGLAGGMLVPIGQLIAAEVAGPEQMGKMISRIWSFSSIGAMIGPTLGGGILQVLGWRWIFLINVPVSAMATVAAFYFLPQIPSRPAGKLDIGGLLRLSLGAPALVFALAQAEQSGSLTALSALIPMLIGLVLVLDFIRHALRSKHPLLDIRLFSRPTFRAGAVTIFFVDIAWFGVLVLIPLSFQQLLGLSPMAAGLLMAPQGIGTAAGMSFSGRLGNTALARNLGALGTFVLAGTTLTLASFGATIPIPVVCVTLLVAGFGAGLSWIPSTAAGYVGLRQDEISHGSPLMTVTMRLGGSFGTAIAAILLQASLDGGSGASLSSVFHASFVWLAAIAALAGVIYIYLCRVVRHTSTSETGSPPPAAAITSSPPPAAAITSSPESSAATACSPGAVCRDRTPRSAAIRLRARIRAAAAR